jgi:hypothetical protein
MEEAGNAPVYCAWEDRHWADPSTLDVLTLLLDQVPTTRLLTVLTRKNGTPGTLKALWVSLVNPWLTS